MDKKRGTIYMLAARRLTQEFPLRIANGTIEKLRVGGGGEREDSRHGMIGKSRALRSVLEQIDVVAPTDSTVLIQGETGTGKELVAQAIHSLSPRRNSRFVKLNCAALPAGLLESELFGHERGAFTGAVMQRTGRFEMADGGTLFLDEIGEMALDLQVKLLRVLQEQEFERVGGTRTMRVDVRLVAATNSDLLQMIEERQFRADLYYRLNVFPVSLPPLRDRPEDVPPLVWYFTAKYAERLKKTVDAISAETMEAMLHYDWPGNIRELQNFIERSVILSRGRVLEPPLAQLERQQRNPPGNRHTLEDAQRQYILQALEEANWVVGGRRGAAARLGIPRTTLISKMQRLGIQFPGEERLSLQSPHLQF
jgi:formate hydrogenlyase transcriptional activator